MKFLPQSCLVFSRPTAEAFLLPFLSSIQNLYRQQCCLVFSRLRPRSNHFGSRRLHRPRRALKCPWCLIILCDLYPFLFIGPRPDNCRRRKTVSIERIKEIEKHQYWNSTTTTEKKTKFISCGQTSKCQRRRLVATCLSALGKNWLLPASHRQLHIHAYLWPVIFLAAKSAESQQILINNTVYNCSFSQAKRE